MLRATLCITLIAAVHMPAWALEDCDQYKRTEDLQKRLICLNANNRELQGQIDELAKLDNVDINVVSASPEQTLPCDIYYREAMDFEKAISKVECPADSIRIAGGCSMTCGEPMKSEGATPDNQEFKHFISEPTASGWRCGVISNDSSRTFNSIAVCLTPRSVHQ